MEYSLRKVRDDSLNIKFRKKIKWRSIKTKKIDNFVFFKNFRLLESSGCF